MGHDSTVVEMAAWRSSAMRQRRKPVLLALGASLQCAGSQTLKLELAKRGDRTACLPVAEVALADAEGLGGSDLGLEMADDLVVCHGPYYWPTNIGIRINSHYDRVNISKMETIGARIEAARKALGLNQTQLSLQVGVNQSTISAIENGASFGADVLIALSAALFKSPQYLMTGKPEAFELSDMEAKMIAAFRAASPPSQQPPDATKDVKRRAGGVRGMSVFGELDEAPAPRSKAK